MATTPTNYRVQGRSAAGLDASISAGGLAIPIDTTWPPAQDSRLPGPAELLASAFAACLLKNLARAATMMPFTYQSAEVDVEARRQDTPPRFVEIEYQMRIVTGEDQRHLDLLHRNLRQFGTVFNTLAAVCDVHGTIVAVPSDQGLPTE